MFKQAQKMAENVANIKDKQAKRLQVRMMLATLLAAMKGK
jgi:hypothetical protein